MNPEVRGLRRGGCQQSREDTSEKCGGLSVTRHCEPLGTDAVPTSLDFALIRSEEFQFERIFSPNPRLVPATAGTQVRASLDWSGRQGWRSTGHQWSPSLFTVTGKLLASASLSSPQNR